MNFQAGVEEEIDEGRRRADKNRRRERRQYRPASLRRLMHILRMTSHRPETRAQQQSNQRAEERPRGETVSQLLERGTPGKVRSRGIQADAGNLHAVLTFKRAAQRSLSQPGR